MSNYKLIASTVFSIFLLGCTSVPEFPFFSESILPVAKAQIPTAQTTKTLTPDEADALIIATINAINEKDATFILPYLLERDQNIENVEEAFKNYGTYFQGEDLTRFERLNVEKLGEIGSTLIQRFNYRIYNNSGISSEISIYQDNRIRLNDPFFFYSLYANRLVERYVSAIQSQEVEQLSPIFNIEEEWVNQAELKAVLEQYQNLFALEVVGYRLTGFNAEQQHFVYTLSGNNGNEHEIKVIYGDGMVSIQDSFLSQNH